MNEQAVGALVVGLVVGCAVACGSSDDSTHSPAESGAQSEGGRTGGTSQGGNATGGTGQGGNATGGTSQGGGPGGTGGDPSGGTNQGGGPTGGASSGGSAGEGAATSGAGHSGSNGEGGSGGVEEPELMLLDCISRDPTGATVFDDAITSDQAWSGTIHLDGVVSVTGATLTIEAGTDVVAAQDSGLEIANDARIVVTGTRQAPVRFCGESEQQGFWNGLKIGPNAMDISQLRNVLVADAGADTQAILLETITEVVNLQSRNSGADGIRAVDFAEGSQYLSIEGASSSAVVLTGSSAATHFPLGGFLANNGDNTVHLAFAEIATDVILSDTTIPYVQDETINVTSGSLTISAGIEYRVASDSSLRIGGAGDPSLFINGTEDSPVQIRGVVAQSSDWESIVLLSSSSTSSQLTHVDIAHAGSNGGFALFAGEAAMLDHVRISDSAGGIFIQSRGLAPSSTDLTVADCAGYPIAAHPNALVTLPTGGVFVGNGADVVRVDNGTFTANGTVPNLGIPYRFDSGLETSEGSHLTIAPGTEFVFPPGSGMEVGASSTSASITAIGTESDPILISAPLGTWPGIVIGPNVTGDSAFEYVELLNGDPACLTLNTPISVTNSTFNNCEYGILKTQLDTTDYTVSNAFISMGQGGVGNLD